MGVEPSAFRAEDPALAGLLRTVLDQTRAVFVCLDAHGSLVFGAPASNEDWYPEMRKGLASQGSVSGFAEFESVRRRVLDSRRAGGGQFDSPFPGAIATSTTASSQLWTVRVASPARSLRPGR